MRKKERKAEKSRKDSFVLAGWWVFCLFFVGGSLFVCPEASARECSAWRAVLKKKGLLLSSTRRKVLLRAALGKKRPLPAGEHRRLVRRYDELKPSLETIRRCFLQQYRKARTWRQRRAVLRRVEKTLRAVLAEALLPLWIGTPWSFYGASPRPHQKNIACGYFVTHVLRGLGFRFPESDNEPREGDPQRRGYAFARLTATKMMRILSSPRRWWARFRRHPIGRLQKPLRRYGPGIYLLGLDNHVGLVLYHERKAFFWHSAYSSEAWVKRENLFRARAVLRSRYRRLGKIRLATYGKWLWRRPILVRKPPRKRPPRRR